ncbi:hypothetical protein EJB05_26515 [Eragrostis curvula]|uniref:Uncharacterized protein n=1 Tax=Eragrostis curvula TaxID=38414 RepID=A0A5J9ULH2_9POAL|nr:hypothetical protein EJB05_26515 [Eragrostis curvula]
MLDSISSSRRTGESFNNFLGCQSWCCERALNPSQQLILASSSPIPSVYINKRPRLFAALKIILQQMRLLVVAATTIQN